MKEVLLQKIKQKFKVSISGHRDLKQTKIKEYYQAIKSTLLEIMEQNKDKEILVVSPLAEGADRLIVKVALDLGLKYEVLLPMRASIYAKDFETDESYQEFNSLLLNSKGYKITPIYKCEETGIENTPENIQDYGKNRNLQYQKMGKDLVDATDAMIFLWDSIVNNKIGGTSDILQYAKNSDTIIYEILCEREN
jgi:hypothetical protein